MGLRKFYKLEGTENDFIFFNAKAPLETPELLDKIRALCHRQKGIGADGLVFLNREKKGWSWNFYNRDSSRADVCGNAARCAAALLVHLGEANLSWEGNPGTFQAQKVGETEFAVNWPLQTNQSKAVSEQLMDDLSSLNNFGLAGVHWIQAGVPHLVLLNHDSWSEEHRIVNSPQLRAHPALGKEGANITWVSLKSLSAVTFERGVEAETRSCGSGAIAAFAAVRAHRKLTKSSDRLSFQFPGGRLSVFMELENSPKIWLEGAAHLVFEGTLKGDMEI
jgi:diaminopimelate epimerase